MTAPNAWKHYSPRKLTCLFFSKIPGRLRSFFEMVPFEGTG